MDNLDSLFDKKEYQLILDLTKDSQDPKELLMRVGCLIILGKTDEALDEIEKNQSIIETKYQLRLMKLHFELLFSKDLLDEAYLALKHYQDLPYVSQEVEEFMQEVDYKINHPQTKFAARLIDIDDIFDILEKGTDQAQISKCLYSLKTYNINIYIDSLKIFLLREDVHPNFRMFGLFLLIDHNYDAEIKMFDGEKVITVNPAKLVPPFTGKEFEETRAKIDEKSDKNVSIKEAAFGLLNCYIMDSYPRDIYKDGCDKLATIFIILAKEYLGEDTSSYDEELLKSAQIIKELIQSTPEIRF